MRSLQAQNALFFDMKPKHPVVSRLMEVTGAKNARDLARILEAPYSTVGSWNQRGSVPVEHLERVAIDKGCTVDWLLHGGDRTQNALSTSQVHKKRATVSHLPAGSNATTPSHLRASTAVLAGDDHIDWSFTASPVRPDTTRTVGTANTEAQAAQRPVTVADTIRPLVLSTDLQETGQRVEFRVMPRFVGVVDAGGADGSSGGSSADDNMDRLGEMAFTFAWLRKQFASSGDKLASIEVQGHGMAPALEDGDTIIIDTAATRVDRTGWYVIRLRGTRVIKHIKVRLDESLLASSDAFGRDTEVLGPREAERLQVVGRMVWPRIR